MKPLGIRRVSTKHYSAVLRSSFYPVNGQEQLSLLTLEGSDVTALIYSVQSSSTD